MSDYQTPQKEDEVEKLLDEEDDLNDRENAVEFHTLMEEKGHRFKTFKGKHALPSEVAAATTKAETTTAATTVTNDRPAKKVKKCVREKAEVAAATTKAETKTAATTVTNDRPAKKVKKCVREKARRDALNDRFEDLSKCLQENPDDDLKTDKSSIVIAARACILVLREQLEKLNACLDAERSEWAKTKREMIAEKILVEQKLQNFMAKTTSLTVPALNLKSTGALKVKK